MPSSRTREFQSDDICIVVFPARTWIRNYLRRLAELSKKKSCSAQYVNRIEQGRY